jgi:hypothetical protein
MLKRLQALGLVDRSRSAADERTTHVELTPKGRNLRRRQSPGGGVALLADPRRRPSRSSTPDHTEPIHLVNQRRCVNGGFKSKMVA